MMRPVGDLSLDKVGFTSVLAYIWGRKCLSRCRSSHFVLDEVSLKQAGDRSGTGSSNGQGWVWRRGMSKGEGLAGATRLGFLNEGVRGTEWRQDAWQIFPTWLRSRGGDGGTFFSV